MLITIIVLGVLVALVFYRQAVLRNVNVELTAVKTELATFKTSLGTHVATLEATFVKDATAAAADVRNVVAAIKDKL